MNLFDHQKSLVLNSPDKHALIWETGTGKTYASLALIQKKKLLTFLVICPKGLVQKWEKEVLEFGIVNQVYRIISKEQFKIHMKELPPFDAVIVDEAHYFFGTTSALMKSLREYFKKWDTKYRYFLSGTPYRSSPMDIYIMCALLGKKLPYWEFHNEFFYTVQMGSRSVPVVKTGIQHRIAELVHSVGSIVKLEECVDMPPELYTEDIVEPTKEQKDAIALLEGILPVTRYTAEHQIAGGTLKGNEYEPSTFYASNKLAKLKDRVASIDRTIVVCRYNNEIEYLQEELKSVGKRIEVIRGSTENREDLLKSLDNEDRYILIVNAKISEGWELTSCSHMIFYSYDFELKNYIQMFGRLRRLNKPRPVMYISIMVKDTIDMAVWASLKNKQDFHLAIYARSQMVL